jgi:hypothetical protein
MGDFNFPKLIGETGQPRVTKIVKTSEKVSEIAICSNSHGKH